MNKMKTMLSLLIIFSSLVANASDLCFIAKEKNQVIKQEGECSKRYAPQSTFKMPLALMGFDRGVF